MDLNISKYKWKALTTSKDIANNIDKRTVNMTIITTFNITSDNDKTNLTEAIYQSLKNDFRVDDYQKQSNQATYKLQDIETNYNYELSININDNMLIMKFSSQGDYVDVHKNIYNKYIIIESIINQLNYKASKYQVIIPTKNITCSPFNYDTFHEYINSINTVKDVNSNKYMYNIIRDEYNKKVDSIKFNDNNIIINSNDYFFIKDLSLQCLAFTRLL